MKKFITAVFCTALALSVGFTAYAADNLDRDYIEAEIWDEMWHGKDDDGYIFPEASYKHHLLDKWLDDNYGSDEYDWSELGELKYEYKRYYKNYIDGWDFEDDNSGNWTISTEDGKAYSFTMMNDTWIMIDENGDTVDSFPPYSTLEDDTTDSDKGYQINGDGADSPRVIGRVTGRTETPSDGGTASGRETTSLTASNGSDGKQSGSGAMLYLVGGIAVVGAGAAGYYIMKKKK